jgi:O-antigen/teichoic acid export membrane protein
MQSLRRAISETSGTNLLGMLLQLTSGIIAARVLGPEGRGQLAAMQLWPSCLVTFGSLGLMTATAYYCGREPSSSGRILGTAWFVLATLSIPLMALGYWLMPVLLKSQNSDVIRTARFLLLLIPVQFSGNLPFNALQGMGRFRIWNLIRPQFTVLWIGVLLAALWFRHRDASFVALGYLVAMSIHCATWIVSMFCCIPGPYRPEPPLVRPLLQYGLPAVASGVPQQLNLRLDQLLMAAFLPPRLLGLYAVAVAASGAISPVLAAVSQVMFARLAGLSSVVEQGAAAARALRLSALAGAGLIAGLSVAMPVFLPLAFGSAFRPAIPAALVLTVASGIASLNLIAGECIRGMGLPRLPLIAESLGLVFTFVLLALLLKPYQLMGAAVASLVSYAVVFATYLWLLNRRTNIPFRMFLFARGAEIRDLLRGVLAGPTRVVAKGQEA